MQLSNPETRPQLSRCAECCLRCLVLVVLLGPPLIYHDGSCGATTGSMQLCINLSRILNGTQSSEMGLYDLGSCSGLFGFGRATALARRQVFGSLDLRKHDVRNEHSQAFVFATWRITNSGWILSRPDALPDFNFLMAASSSSTVKSDDRLASAVAALESEVTSCGVQRAKSLCASGKRPLFTSCEAVAFAVPYWTPRVRRDSSCHALRLQCVKSTDSITSVHLALRNSSSFLSSDVAVVSMSSLLPWWWPVGVREGGGCTWHERVEQIFCDRQLAKA